MGKRLRKQLSHCAGYHFHIAFPGSKPLYPPTRKTDSKHKKTPELPEQIFYIQFHWQAAPQNSLTPVLLGPSTGEQLSKTVLRLFYSDRSTIALRAKHSLHKRESFVLHENGTFSLYASAACPAVANP
jgi:hypothetical protein